MLDVADDTLTWVWAAPLLAGIICFAFGRAPLLWTRLLIALVAQGVALGSAVLLGARALSRGSFALFDLDGWVGARILGADPTGMLTSSLGPSQVPLLIAVELAGLLTVGLVAHHGRTAKSSAGSAAVLWATGMCALLVVARDTVVVACAFAGAGVAGFALLVCFHPKRTEVEGAVRLFVIHRVGDALVLVAVLVVGASVGGAVDGRLQLEALPAVAPSLDPWWRATAGPFTGFAAREVWLLAAALFTAGACTRLVGVPLARDAVGAPGAALGFAHGVCFTGAALVLAFRATPLLWLAPEVLSALGAVGVAGAVVAAVLALSARDVVRSDVLLLGGFASLGAIAAAGGDVATLVFGASVLMLGAVPLCASSGAVVDASGTADPHALGGLEKILPRTHTTRLLAGGALFGPLFAGATMATHLVERALFAPWLGAAPFGVQVGALGAAASVLAVLAALAVLALAAFRPLHLVFTGSTTRAPMPAVKPGAPPPADPPPTRTVPALAIALVLLGVGLAHLPTGIVANLPNVETYRSPLQVLTLPDRAELEPVRLHLLPPTGPSVARSLGVGPGFLLALVVGALAAGWLASALVYRGGPGRLHRALIGGRRARTVVALVAGVAGGESQVVRGVGEGAIRLSRLIATNLAPGVLDTLLRRLPALFGFLVGFIVRLIANGNAQRGIAVAVIVLVVLLWRFAEAPR